MTPDDPNSKDNVRSVSVSTICLHIDVLKRSLIYLVRHVTDHPKCLGKFHQVLWAVHLDYIRISVYYLFHAVIICGFCALRSLSSV